MPERDQPPKNELLCSFSGVVGGGGGQRKVKPLKMSATAHFWGLWVVVVARRGEPPKNKLSCSLSGVVSSGRLKALLKLNKKLKR